MKLAIQDRSAHFAADRRCAIARRSPAIVLSAVLTALGSACQGTATPQQPTAAGQGVAVQVSPATTSLAPNGTAAFTATVTGTANTAVAWNVVEPGGGTVDATGHYTAPATTGTYTVRATSVADGTAAADAAVTVTAPAPGVTVTLSPSPAATNSCLTVTFTATVANAANRSVTWSVQESAGGTITSGGVYTAPASAGTYHVVATSVADPTKSAVSTVTVTDRIVSIAVAPSTTTLTPSGTAQFTATVTTTCGSFASTGAVP